MSALGIRLSVLAGPTVPVPLPADTTARLRSVQVTETDEERSVFTLTLDGGRSGPTGALDAPLLTGSPLGVGARVVLVVTAGVVPTILMDGIVTTVELMPSDEPGGATLRVTGEDVSLLLDRQEKDAEWPALDDYPQVLAILGPYATQGIVPMAIPPTDMDPPLPIERIPTQHGTDLAHLTTLAAAPRLRHLRDPGTAAGHQHLLLGTTGAGRPAAAGDVGRPRPGHQRRCAATVSRRLAHRSPPSRAACRIRPPARPPRSWPRRACARRWRRRRCGSPRPVRCAASGCATSGTGATTALARAQAQVDRSIDAVVGEGELDGARYGAVLRPRGLVGMRGAGWSHDGLWYVRRVEHNLAPGSYRQLFTIAREGYGSTVPVVLT